MRMPVRMEDRPSGLRRLLIGAASVSALVRAAPLPLRPEAGAATATPTVVTFSTAGTSTWTVPTNVCQATFTVDGAAGGTGGTLDGNVGGAGAQGEIRRSACSRDSPRSRAAARSGSCAGPWGPGRAGRACTRACS